MSGRGSNRTIEDLFEVSDVTPNGGKIVSSDDAVGLTNPSPPGADRLPLLLLNSCYKTYWGE